MNPWEGPQKPRSPKLNIKFSVGCLTTVTKLPRPHVAAATAAPWTRVACKLICVLD